MLKPILRNYKGYLLPKRRLAIDGLVYHVCSSFFSLIAFVMCLLLECEQIMAACISLCVALITFAVLYRVNNTLYEVDKAMIEELIATSKVDGIELVQRFLVQIQDVFAAEGVPYFGSATVDAESIPIEPLFMAVFHESGPDLAKRFQAQAGSFLRFIGSLSIYQRELLYRYYLKV